MAVFEKTKHNACRIKEEKPSRMKAFLRSQSAVNMNTNMLTNTNTCRSSIHRLSVKNFLLKI